MLEPDSLCRSRAFVHPHRTHNWHVNDASACREHRVVSPFEAVLEGAAHTQSQQIRGGDDHVKRCHNTV